MWGMPTSLSTGLRSLTLCCCEPSFAVLCCFVYPTGSLPALSLGAAASAWASERQMRISSSYYRNHNLYYVDADISFLLREVKAIPNSTRLDSDDLIRDRPSVLTPHQITLPSVSNATSVSKAKGTFKMEEENPKERMTEGSPRTLLELLLGHVRGKKERPEKSANLSKRLIWPRTKL